jgi:hypothetical protein
MRRKRSESGDIFGLAFLDIISCGFGAVILLFIMTTRITGEAVEQRVEDMSAEIERVLLQLEEEQTELADIQEQIVTEQELLAQLRDRARAAENAVEDKKDQATAARLAEREEIERISRLNNQIKRVEADIQRLEQAQQTSGEAKENAIRDSAGQERRHYLTGLRIDGDRAVLLIDVSLSMLDYRLVDIIRYQVASPQDKLKSRKWVRVLDSVDWLLASLEAKEYQIYLYNQEVRASLPGTTGTWLQRSDHAQLQDAAEALWNFPPVGGSNLEKALDAVMELEPRPDNIYVLTDGLPNHSSMPGGALVTGSQRVTHFRAAQRRVPTDRKTAVHTILFPLQGDPDAPAHYWTLAHRTGGSFFSPAPDWPN